MKLTDAMRLSGSALHRNPMRTLLTILGLGVGVGAILTVITLGMAGERQVETEISRLGVDKVWVTAAGRESPLRSSAGETVSARAGLEACADAMTAGVITAGDAATTCLISGYDSGFASVYEPEILAGRLFTAREYAAGIPVALVDETLAVRLGEDAVGTIVDVGSRRVRIVGVVSPLTSHITSAAQPALLLPLNTFLDTFPRQVDRVTVSIPRHLSAEETGQAAVAALAGTTACEASSLTEQIEAVEQVVRIFVMVLACVAAVCMLTGSIGVMNILLVSVRERRREIGLLKAIGGTAAQVGVLFLLEAVTYALLGGLLGLLLSLVMIRLFSAWIGLEAVLSPGTAVPTVLIAGLLGVAFGVAPALRAAGLQPVDALRQDP